MLRREGVGLVGEAGEGQDLRIPSHSFLQLSFISIDAHVADILCVRSACGAT